MDRPFHMILHLPPIDLKGVLGLFVIFFFLLLMIKHLHPTVPPKLKHLRTKLKRE